MEELHQPCGAPGCPDPLTAGDKGWFGFDRLVTVYVNGQFGDLSLDIFVKAF